MAMVTKAININGRVFCFDAEVNALAAIEAIRDMYCLQGGRILENGTRIVADTEIFGELTGALSFVGGRQVGMDRNMTLLFILVPVTDPNETLYVFLSLRSYIARRSPTSR